MFIESKIKYLDYMENNVRCKGVGFVKIEVWDSFCHFQIQISGMHITDHYVRKVIFEGESAEKIIDEVLLESGKGSLYIVNLDTENLAGSGISYEELLGIRIPIATGKEIYCKIQEKRIKPEKTADAGVKTEAIRESEKPVETEEVLLKAEAIREQEGSVEIEALGELEVPVEMKPVETEEVPSGNEKFMEGTSLNEIHDNKWNQLHAIYPHICPFGDEREYLSIGPGDFMVLSEKYYPLVNNSFLLHGYYNYGHLILNRVENRNQVSYYIGVPGNFYEREKQVAILFGFESFEGLEEPAKAGDYGYYMMKVAL